MYIAVILENYSQATEDVTVSSTEKEGGVHKDPYSPDMPEGERNYFKTFWKAFQGAKGKKRVNKIEHFKKGTKKEALREKREMGSYKILFYRKYLWKLFKLGIILNMMIFCPFLFRPFSFRTIKISRDYTIFQITCVYKKNNKILGIV